MRVDAATIPAEKVCRGCQRSLPPTAFYRDRATSDGLQARCKVCRDAHHAAYIAAHREEKRARKRAWYEAHREEVLAQERARRTARRAQRQAG